MVCLCVCFNYIRFACLFHASMNCMMMSLFQLYIICFSNISFICGFVLVIYCLFVCLFRVWGRDKLIQRYKTRAYKRGL